MFICIRKSLSSFFFPEDISETRKGIQWSCCCMSCNHFNIWIWGLKSWPFCIPCIDFCSTHQQKKLKKKRLYLFVIEFGSFLQFMLLTNSFLLQFLHLVLNLYIKIWIPIGKFTRIANTLQTLSMNVLQIV